MWNVVSLDGHAVVNGDAEREERRRVVRHEGVQLINLYQSIPDKTVRDAVLAVVSSLVKPCG